MEKAAKYLIGAMTLAFCFTSVISEACVTVDTKNETYTVDDSGCVKY